MKKRAIEEIENLIEVVRELKYDDSKNLDDVKRRTALIIRKTFGNESPYLKDLINIRFSPSAYSGDYKTRIKAWKRGKDQFLNLLNILLEDLKWTEEMNSDTIKEITISSNKVFVIHGHDVEMKIQVVRVLERLHLDPVVLHELPNQGRTIIEKITDYSDVGAAVVLYSPDDIGYKSEKPDEARPRARQNVIFEHGYFIGKLGRKNVLMLHRVVDDFEMLSDYSGVLYTPFDKSGAWQLELVKELKSIGYEIDADNLIDK